MECEGSGRDVEWEGMWSGRDVKWEGCGVGGCGV